MHFLGPLSLLECARVCKRWREWARAESLWKRHDKRVHDALGEYVTPYEMRLNTPTWVLFVAFLRKDHKADPWANHLRLKTLVQLPGPTGWNARVLHLIGYPVHYRVEIWRMDYEPKDYGFEVMFKEDPTLTSGLDMRSLPFNVSCIFDRAVHPVEWRRFHSIVFDTDCSEPRDERYWLRVLQ